MKRKQKSEIDGPVAGECGWCGAHLDDMAEGFTKHIASDCLKAPDCLKVTCGGRPSKDYVSPFCLRHERVLLDALHELFRHFPADTMPRVIREGLLQDAANEEGREAVMRFVFALVKHEHAKKYSEEQFTTRLVETTA